MPLIDTTTEEVLSSLSGKHIAIVANSPVILEQRNGGRIDTADMVIRMNGATPCRFPERIPAIGARTDILTCGIIQPYAEVLKEIPPRFWWMKVTENGAKKRRHLFKWMRDTEQESTLWQWPDDREKRIRDAIGVPGSSGIRIIDTCVEAGAANIEVYGMTFWNGGTEQSWYSKMPIHESHDAAKEYDYFEKAYRFNPGVMAGRWSWTAK